MTQRGNKIVGLALGGIVLALAASTLPGETQLVLIDGRILSGTNVRRDGDEYVLLLDNGHEITIPVPLVETVRLEGDDRDVRRRQAEERTAAEAKTPAEERAAAAVISGGLTPTAPRNLSGTSQPSGPSGLQVALPRTLAGEAVRPPTTAEQLRVLGAPAEFTKNIVDNSWTPTSDWNMDPHQQNNFAPSKWADDVVDNSWEPESAFDKNEDVLESGRATWQKSIVDNSWTPQDGFKK